MPVRVLIADDYSAHQKLMGNIVSAVGGVMCGAADGLEALRLAEDGEGEGFDIALLDMQMPGLGGAEVADRLIGRWRNRFRRPRIVAVTGESTPERRVLCRAIGMDGFIAKPFDAATMKGALRQVTIFGHCWTDGPSERAMDLARFLVAAERSEFEAWAAEAPRALGEAAGDPERMREFREDALAFGFEKLAMLLGPGERLDPEVDSGRFRRALDALRVAITAGREALLVSRWPYSSCSQRSARPRNASCCAAE